MFRDEAAYYRIAHRCAIAAGVLFASAYWASFDIQQIADNGFENAVIWWIPIPYPVQATFLAFLLGWLLIYGSFALFSPFPPLEESPWAWRMRWAGAVFLSGFATIYILIEAFLCG